MLRDHLQFGQLKQLKKNLHTSGMTLNAASGHAIQNLGFVECEIHLGQVNMRNKVYIVKGLQEGAIIRADFLKRSKAIIDMPQDIVTFQVERGGKLALVQNSQEAQETEQEAATEEDLQVRKLIHVKQFRSPWEHRQFLDNVVDELL